MARRAVPAFHGCRQTHAVVFGLRNAVAVTGSAAAELARKCSLPFPLALAPGGSLHLGSCNRPGSGLSPRVVGAFTSHQHTCVIPVQDYFGNILTHQQLALRVLLCLSRSRARKGDACRPAGRILVKTPVNKAPCTTRPAEDFPVSNRGAFSLEKGHFSRPDDQGRAGPQGVWSDGAKIRGTARRDASPLPHCVSPS